MRGSGTFVVMLSSLVGFSFSTVLFSGVTSNFGLISLALLAFSLFFLGICLLKRSSDLRHLISSCDDVTPVKQQKIFDGFETLERLSKKLVVLRRQRDEARLSHKNAEKGRQFAEQILEAVLNNHQIAALLIDRNGKLIEANDSALKIVGFRREVVINRSIDSLTCFPFLCDIYNLNWLAELSANGPKILDQSHEGTIYTHNREISIRCDWELKEINLDDQRMYLAFIQPATRQVVKKRFALVKPAYTKVRKRRPPAQSI